MNEKVITVTKTVTEKVQADTVEISVCATGEAKKYAEAAEKAGACSRAVVQAFSEIAEFDVKSIGCSVRAVKEGNKTVGYRAVDRSTVRFKADKGLQAAALDILNTNACEWELAYTLDADMSEKLLSRAVEQAHKSALTIATAAKVKLGELVKAEYCSSDNGAPMLMRAAAGIGDNADPRCVTLRETVICSWAVE